MPLTVAFTTGRTVEFITSVVQAFLTVFAAIPAPAQSGKDSRSGQKIKPKVGHARIVMIYVRIFTTLPPFACNKKMYFWKFDKSSY